jgi:CheY-like chemotaxis protein
MTATRVVLAEDQPMVRAGFRALLDSRDGIEVVGEAATGAEALEQARELRPDVVVMDIRMPEMDGLEATREITRDRSLSHTRVLVLTTFELDEYVSAPCGPVRAASCSRAASPPTSSTRSAWSPAENRCSRRASRDGSSRPTSRSRRRRPGASPPAWTS